MIDELPDTTAEGFEVTSENVDAYTTQLQAVSEAIGTYIQAGGNDADLDTVRFDNLTAAVSAYHSMAVSRRWLPTPPLRPLLCANGSLPA